MVGGPDLAHWPPVENPDLLISQVEEQEIEPVTWKSRKVAIFFAAANPSICPEIKGTISDHQFQTSIFSKPPDFFAYSKRTLL